MRFCKYSRPAARQFCPYVLVISTYIIISTFSIISYVDQKERTRRIKERSPTLALHGNTWDKHGEKLVFPVLSQLFHPRWASFLVGKSWDRSGDNAVFWLFSPRSPRFLGGLSQTFSPLSAPPRPLPGRLSPSFSPSRPSRRLLGQACPRTPPRFPDPSQLSPRSSSLLSVPVPVPVLSQAYIFVPFNTNLIYKQ